MMQEAWPMKNMSTTEGMKSVWHMENMDLKVEEYGWNHSTEAGNIFLKSLEIVTCVTKESGNNYLCNNFGQ